MEFKLLIKKINNTLSKDDEIVFTKWYKESIKHKKYFEKVKNNYSKEILNVDIEKGWEELMTKVNSKKQHKLYYWKYGIAAAVVLLITSPFTLNNFSLFSKKEIVSDVVIMPGSDKAVLTTETNEQIKLEKGEKINLGNSTSDGEKLIYNKPLKTNNKKHLAYNYLTIPRGGQFFLQLSDGTKVWLNSESKLKYPVNFIKGNTREVELVYGEAFIEVSPSTSNYGDKFKVLTLGQEVEVLGTQFNIKAYKDESFIYTTLLEGKVSVGNIGSFKPKVLKPSEQSILNRKTKSIHVSKLGNVYNEVLWKNGVFSFKKMPLKEIAKVLSRWYNVDFVFEKPEVKNILFTGVLDKEQEITQILKVICIANNITYKIDNKVINFK